MLISDTLLLMPDDEGIARAAALLQAGGLVAFPTETVYGLGADASSTEAVARIFAAKGRPSDHPVIVHLADAAQVDDWAFDAPDVARALGDAFWPGPLTLILRRRPRVLDAVTGGQDTVGLRVPGHPVARALLTAFGGGVAAPSANRFGRVSPTDYRHVLADLGGFLDPARDAILTGGPSDVGVESTIVDCSDSTPRILRHGGITAEMLAVVLGNALSSAQPAPGSVRAPGMLDAHYAPAARVEVVEADQLVDRMGELSSLRVGVLCPHPVGLPVAAIRLDAPDQYDGSSLAPILYARFRDADRLGLEVLLVVPPAAEGLGVAVRDRLARAAFGSR